ncbi:hypothetical protein SARC_13663, partial [Sphaeroforma arctica JP610]
MPMPKQPTNLESTKHHITSHHHDDTQNRHTKTHAFLKIRIPIPPLANPRSVLLPAMYPGGKFEVTAPLTMGTLWELQQTTHFDQ